MIRSLHKSCMLTLSGRCFPVSSLKINFNSSGSAKDLTAYQNDVSRAFHMSHSFEVEGRPIKMPSLSPTMMEGTIVQWLKEEGDSFEPGDLLCDIQTDKAVVSLETDDEGVLAKILVKNDTKDVKVGTLIALMVEEGEDWKSVEMPAESSDSESHPDKTVSSETQQLPDSSKQKATHYGPSVRILLEKYGLTENEVSATGPHGSLLKGDVLNFIQQKNLQPAPISSVAPPMQDSPAAGKDQFLEPKSTKSDEAYDDIELTSMRKTIAKRLTQSKSTIAHTYSTFDCNLEAMVKLRKKLKEDGINVSINDLVIKCVATALTRCPDINAVWQGDELVLKNEVDISVAVATDAGLITPIIKGANNLGVVDISEKIRDLASRAKSNKLKLDEFQGGTFTISNLGMFGIREFTAIINPPQCAILAVGGGRLELNEEGNPETRMSATMSYDQAAISDDSAAIFLSNVQDLLENPLSIILGSSKKVKHPLADLL